MVGTRRWAKIEVEKRRCDCGISNQDEVHVLLKCTRTEDYNNLGELMDKMNVHMLVPFVYNCMKLFG